MLIDSIEFYFLTKAWKNWKQHIPRDPSACHPASSKQRSARGRPIPCSREERRQSTAPEISQGKMKMLQKKNTINIMNDGDLEQLILDFDALL